jgi:hypothetical protein
VRRLPVLAPALAGVCLSGCGLLRTRSDHPAHVVRGPIPARTQEAIKLTYLFFRPRRATTQPVGTTDLTAQTAYSSLYQNGHGGSDDVVFDSELSHTSLSARRGVSPGTDVEIELGVTFATAGFMDSIIEDYHRFLGFPSEGRQNRPRNEYEMDVRHNGLLAYRLEPDEPGLSDVPIVVTHQFIPESDSSPAFSARAGIELPTGSESKGFGNGALDWGGGLLAEKSFDRWTATAAVDYVFTGTSDSFERAGITAHDDLDVQFGLEYRWNDGLSLLLGTVLESPVTRDIPLKEIDGNILSIDIGASWDVGERSRFLVEFGEDAIARSGPDLTLMAAWTWSL